MECEEQDMPKLFLTARDIDYHADRGVKELPIDDNVVLTDIAREQARARGVRLVKAENAIQQITECHTDNDDEQELHAKVKSAVIANLGGTPDNLDIIITRILNGLK
jgi:tRNA A22 N-methylase